MSLTKWTQAELDAARLEADPLADKVIAEIYARGSIEAVNELMVTLTRNDEPPPMKLPPVARAYFADPSPLPTWADSDVVDAGAGIFMRYGLLALASLLCASLPECYAMRNGVRVLSLSRQLGSHTERRVYETAQMVIDVMSHGGLRPGGRGLRSSQKVRLLHASMRYLLEIDPEGVSRRMREERSLAGALVRTPWDPAWGRPINQEDMAFTLQTFSTVILRSWERLGVVLDRHEVEAYYHCWRVVGHVIGVRESLNPPTVEGGYALYEAIRRHQQGETTEGVLMTRALAATVSDTVGLLWVSDQAVTVLMRHLLGDATARIMGVAEVSTAEVLAMEAVASGLHVGSWVRELIGDNFHPVHSVIEWFGQRLLTRIARVDRGGRRVFHLPESLRAAWLR